MVLKVETYEDRPAPEADEDEEYDPSFVKNAQYIVAQYDGDFVRAADIISVEDAQAALRDVAKDSPNAYVENPERSFDEFAKSQGFSPEETQELKQSLETSVQRYDQEGNFLGTAGDAYDPENVKQFLLPQDYARYEGTRERLTEEGLMRQYNLLASNALFATNEADLIKTAEGRDFIYDAQTGKTFEITGDQFVEYKGFGGFDPETQTLKGCLLYTSPSPRDS